MCVCVCTCEQGLIGPWCEYVSVCSLEQPWTLHPPHMQRVLTERWLPAVITLLTDALSHLTPSLSKTTDSNETARLAEHNKVW